MGYPTKVQLIKRKDSEQWYVNFPAVALAMEFQKGETIEWDSRTAAHSQCDAPNKARSWHAKKNASPAPEIQAGTVFGMNFLPAPNLATRPTHQPVRRLGATHRGRADLRLGTASRRLVGRLPPVRPHLWEPDDLFVPVVRATLHLLPEEAPFVAWLDDTGLRKTGRKTAWPMAATRCRRPPRQPRAPPAVRATLGVPAGTVPAPARGVPVRFSTNRRCPPRDPPA